MTITFDALGGPDPEPDDVLVTRAGSAYTIRAVRRVRSSVSEARFSLEVDRGHEGGREIPFRWYPRGPVRKRQSVW